MSGLCSSDMITHANFFIIIVDFIIEHQLNILKPHFLQYCLKLSIIYDAWDISQLESLARIIWIFGSDDLTNLNFLIEELELEHFNDKSIPIALWNVDYFEFPLNYSNLFKRVCNCQRLTHFKKIVENIAWEVPQGLIRRRLVVLGQILKYTWSRLILWREHATVGFLEQGIFILIKPRVCFSEHLVTAVKCQKVFFSVILVH